MGRGRRPGQSRGPDGAPDGERRRSWRPGSHELPDDNVEPEPPRDPQAALEDRLRSLEWPKPPPGTKERLLGELMERLEPDDPGRGPGDG